MLLISTYVEKSKIEGLGLFAGQDINEGDIVWFLDPTVDTIIPENRFDGVLNWLPKEHAENFKNWVYKREDDYVLCADNTKFANHSNTPNLGGNHRQYDVALRDIKMGEELTYNYRIFDFETDIKLNKGNSYEQVSERTERKTGTEESRETNGETSN